MPKHVITRDPEILGGSPVFDGTRVPFDALLDYIEGGLAALEEAKALVAAQV